MSIELLTSGMNLISLRPSFEGQIASRSLSAMSAMLPAEQRVPLLPPSPSADQRLAPATEKAELLSEKADAELAGSIHRINEALRSQNLALKFHRDEETGSVVVELIDEASGEAVRQIPSEAALRVAAVLGRLQGNLVNEQA